MNLDNKDYLFAQLMGSDAVRLFEGNDKIKDSSLFPFLPIKNTVIVQKIDNPYTLNNLPWQQETSIPENLQYFPLSFSFEESGEKWTFPYEPILNVSSGNNIIKRYIAKPNDKMVGTIKECWGRKDFEITVNGVLFGKEMIGDAQTCYPISQLRKLFSFLRQAKTIYVNSPLLEILGVNKVVVEDYSFPFTKGENAQAYELKLCSDTSLNLLTIDK